MGLVRFGRGTSVEAGSSAWSLGIACAALLSVACGPTTEGSAANPAAEPVAKTTEAIHEGSQIDVSFQVYWFDEGIQLDGDDRDFWARVELAPFGTAPKFGDLQPGCCPGISGGQSLDPTLKLKFNVAPGVESIPMRIGMFEQDSDDPDDHNSNIQDIDPNPSEERVNIDIDLRTGLFTGELSNLCPDCMTCTSLDMPDGMCFTVEVHNHCVDDPQPELPGNGEDDDCDGEIDEPPCCCGDGETCGGGVSDPACTADTDGDGLLDFWETRGFDADCDNDIDVDLPSWGVKPDHKDVIVELDYTLLETRPSQAMIRAVKAGYRSGPVNIDGLDNPDGKGGIRVWVDTGALTDPWGLEPGPSAGSCSDGLDNDGDGLTDETDPDCILNYGMEGVGPCNDGIDNDKDGAADDVDPDCAAALRREGDGTCADGIDNDNNGYTDAYDAWACSLPTGVEGAGWCNDGVDNDGDGAPDLLDPDCKVGDDLRDFAGQSPRGGESIPFTELPKGSIVVPADLSFTAPGSVYETIRQNHFHGNRDLFVHYALAALHFDPTLKEDGTLATEGGVGGARSCDNHIDDDGDGWIDSLDDECSPCDNHIDDDGDGKIDGDDSGCYWNQFDGISNGVSSIVVLGTDAMGFWETGIKQGSPSREQRLSGALPLVLMHELGHDLQLGHGGHETHNCKPNYVSIMNYQLGHGIYQRRGQTQDIDRDNTLDDFAILDFWPPRRAGGFVRDTITSTIKESALKEWVVVNSIDQDNELVMFTPSGWPRIIPVQGLRFDGSIGSCGKYDGTPDGIDWDKDCTIDIGDVQVDLDNSFGAIAECDAANPPGGEISDVLLEARDDWQLMHLRFRDFGPITPMPMPSTAQRRKLAALLNDSHLDLNADGHVRSDGRFELAVQVENFGPQASRATDFVLPLPAGASLFETSAAECKQGLAVGSSNVVCELGRVNAGEVFAFTLVLDVASSTSCQFKPHVFNVTDPTRSDEVTVSIDCGADVSIGITATPSPAHAGEPLTYHLTVANAGPSIAEGVTATLVLPAGVSYQGSTVPCTQGPPSTLTCSLGTLAKGLTTSFDISTTIASDLVFLNGGPLSITAAAGVSSTTEEINAANNFANVSTTVTAVADLEVVSIAAQSPPTELIVGNPVNVVVQEVVTNHGTASPINALVLQSATSTTGSTATPVASSLSAPALVFNTPQTVSATFTLRCDKEGTHTFTLRGEVNPANAADTDPVAANNAKTTTVTVTCTPCLHATEQVILKDATTTTVGEILGGTYFELGAQFATVTGNVFARGNAYMRNNSRINGNLTLFGTLTFLDPHTITGTFLPNTPVTLMPIPTKTVSVGTTDLTVPVNGVGTWAPGTYDEAIVYSGGDARLSAGVYNFRRLQFDSGADLVLNVTGGDVLINARDFADFGDNVRFLKTGNGRVFVYTNSTGPVRIGTGVQFRGTIRAPQAQLNVFSNTTINGCVSARRVNYEPHVVQTQPAGAGTP